MGKLSVATKLADELGKSVDEAYRFVDEVGVKSAKAAADDVAEAGSRTVSKWWKPAAGVGAIGGGGAIAWRQQNLERAKAIARQEASMSDSVASIMDSDLPPDKKQELLRELLNASPSNNNNDDDGGGGPFSDLFGGLFGGGIQQTLALVLVVILALNFALDGGE